MRDGWRRLAGRLGRALGWSVVALLCLVASVAYHLELPQAREAARRAIEDAVRGAIRGEIAIGRLESLGPTRLVATGVVLRDPRGRDVVRADRIVLWPDWRALLSRGVFRTHAVHVDHAEVRLFVAGPNGDEVSIAEALQPRAPGPRRTGGRASPIDVRIDGIRLDDVDVRGDVPHFAGIRADGLRVLGQIAIGRTVLLRIHEASGRMLGPYPGVTEVERIVLDFDVEPEHGLQAYVRVRRGPDRVRARLRLHRPPAASDGRTARVPGPLEAPWQMTLDVHADPVHAETLAAMGIPGTEALAGSARGDLRLAGPVTDLALEAHLVHEGGRVRIAGSLPREGAIVLEGETYDFDLGRLLPRAPPLSVGGTIRTELARDPEVQRRATVRAQTRPLEVAGVALPELRIDAGIERDALVVDRIATLQPERLVEGSGRIAFDGRFDVRIRLDVGDVGGDPHVRRIVPGARGAVRGTIDARAAAGGRQLRLDGALGLLDFRYGPMRARRLTVRGRVRGDMASPIAQLELRGQGVSVAGQDLGDVEARLDGGPHDYAVRWRSVGGRSVRSLLVEATASRRRRAWVLEAPAVAIDVGTGPLRGSVRRVRLRGDEVRIGELELGAGQQRIAADARIRPRGPSHARIELSGIDVARLADLAGARVGTLRGRADAQFELTGSLADPEARLRGTIRELSFDRLRDADVRYDLSYARGVVSANVHGDFGPRGDVDAEGTIRVPIGALGDPPRLRAEAVLDLHVYANHVNLAFVLPLLGDRVAGLGITGRIGGDVRIAGPLGEPRIDPGVLLLDRLALPGGSELRAKIEFGVADGSLRIGRAWIADREGEIALLQGEIPLALDDLPRDPAAWMRTLHERPWRIALRLEPRRLDRWPRPLQRFLPAGVSGGASLTAAGGDGAPVRMDLTATLAWVEAATPSRCARDLRPLVQVFGWTREGRTHFDVVGLTQGRASALVRADAATPVDDWLRDGRLRMPEIDVVVQAERLPLHHLPWVCPRAAGILDGEIALRRLLGPAPDIEGRVEVRHLHVLSPDAPGLQGSEPYRLVAGIRSELRDPTSLGACAILASEGPAPTPLAECDTVQLPRQSEAVVRGALPIRWRSGSILPELDDSRDIDLTMLMVDAPMAPLFAFIPQLAEADALLDGRVLARGPWEDLQLTGGLAIRDGRARLVALGQHLTDVHGAVELRGTRLVIPESAPLVARDGDGTVRVTGDVALRGLVPAFAHLTIAPDEFPVRREGAVLATVSGRAQTRIGIETDGVDGTLSVERLTVRLPERTAGASQPLEPHPDVAVVGRDAPELLVERRPAYPIRLRIDAREPFWVRRNDFAAHVTAELDVTYDEPNLYVAGYAEIQRGYFEVFGKRFDVHGSLQFDGGAEINPVFAIVGVYEIPGRSGATISVRVSGTLDRLAVEFGSTETSDQGEIIALLVSGRSAIGSRDPEATQQQATEQVASVASGLVAGILTLGLRQQFGDVVPVLAIETGSRLGETMIRAGFDADALIPDFARGVVLGAYIEGFVTTGGQTQGGGSGGVGGGVTAEFQLPYDLVLGGTYVPPASAGVDLVWEP